MKNLKKHGLSNFQEQRLKKFESEIKIFESEINDRLKIIYLAFPHVDHISFLKLKTRTLKL